MMNQVKELPPIYGEAPNDGNLMGKIPFVKMKCLQWMRPVADEFEFEGLAISMGSNGTIESVPTPLKGHRWIRALTKRGELRFVRTKHGCFARYYE